MVQEIVITMPETKGMLAEVYSRWVKEAEKTVGWDGRILLFVGSPSNRTWRFTWYRGSLYSQYDGDRKFFVKIEGQPNDSPDVLCSCGSTVFSLRYGSYEIRARCDACGTEDEVYSG